VPIDRRSITVPDVVAARHSVRVALTMGAGWEEVLGEVLGEGGPHRHGCKVRADENTLVVVGAQAGLRTRCDGSGDKNLGHSTRLSRAGDSGHDSWAPLAPQEQHQEQQEAGMPTCHCGAWVFLALEHPSSGGHTASHMVERTLADPGVVKCASQTLHHCEVASTAQRGGSSPGMRCTPPCQAFVRSVTRRTSQAGGALADWAVFRVVVAAVADVAPLPQVRAAILARPVTIQILLRLQENQQSTTKRLV
jgi:hypothetical protein